MIEWTYITSLNWLLKLALSVFSSAGRLQATFLALHLAPRQMGAIKRKTKQILIAQQNHCITFSIRLFFSALSTAAADFVNVSGDSAAQACSRHKQLPLGNAIFPRRQTAVPHLNVSKSVIVFFYFVILIDWLFLRGDTVVWRSCVRLRERGPVILWVLSAFTSFLSHPKSFINYLHVTVNGCSYKLWPCNERATCTESNLFFRHCYKLMIALR